MNQLLQMDFAILDAIRANCTSPVMDRLMIFISMLGTAGILWIVSGLILTCMKDTRKCGIMMLLSLAIQALIVNACIKPLVMRPRPYDLRPYIELVVRPMWDYSFPSGHTAAAFAVATAIFLYDKRWGIPAYIFAVLMAFSRLYLYVHYPSDVLAGMLIGILSGVLAWVIVRKWRIKTGPAAE